jgi:hypothetical protein
MSVHTDADLFRRGADTVVASWEEYARGAVGAFVQRFPGVDIAVFPSEPERAVYNNALLARDLAIAKRADAIDAMEAAYTGAGVARFAAWVHETDEAMRADLEQRGYTADMSTRAMAMPLDDIRVPRPDVELAPPDWAEHLRLADVPPNFLGGAEPHAYHVLIARLGDENVATAMAFDHDGDCGVFNVATLGPARRRGLGTTLTACQMHDAASRGCSTARLQSTEMGRAGLRDGRVPPPRPDPLVRAPR